MKIQKKKFNKFNISSINKLEKTPIYRNHSSPFSMGPEAKESSKY
jgi:hypothetical protein